MGSITRLDLSLLSSVIFFSFCIPDTFIPLHFGSSSFLHLCFVVSDSAFYMQWVARSHGRKCPSATKTTLTPQWSSSEQEFQVSQPTT